METVTTWNGKSFSIKCDPTLPVDAYLQKLQNLTGVPVPKMKLCMRRKQLKSGDKFPEGEVKAGTKFMLIGTAELPPVWTEVPADEPEVFEDELDVVPASARAGCKNYGNTCYLNACIQTLRNIPEFANLIKNYNPETTTSDKFVAALKTWVNTAPENLPPVVAQLRLDHPNFATIDEQSGGYMQQDASECMIAIYQHLAKALGKDFVDLTEFTLRETLEDETGVRPSESKLVTDNRLQCTIDQNVSSIEMGLFRPSIMERKIEGVEGLTTWKQSQKLLSLPKFLTIQMLRFTYRTDEQTTAKIVRKVQHPFRLDVLQFADPELRATIAAAREAGKTEGAGFYSLKAVLTHQGRTANSGHYITHVKVNKQWMRYNDLNVTEITPEDVTNLSGSGDWHCSFLLYYERIDRPEDDPLAE